PAFGIKPNTGPHCYFWEFAKKKYRIDLPAKAVEILELEKNTSLVLMVDNKTLTIRPSRTVEMLPQIMMRWYLIPAVLAAVIFFCLSWSN
ncbi:AbrB/MazE/SpoVT family DNA-binding domain-containing protein, partial [Escherichia coli]|nr:AbrB/MazE/SpoVT family DNA-binding domain-containing protein [Escherichia coli]